MGNISLYLFFIFFMFMICLWIILGIHIIKTEDKRKKFYKNLYENYNYKKKFYRGKYESNS